jgi:hypothetical protein
MPNPGRGKTAITIMKATIQHIYLADLLGIF